MKKPDAITNIEESEWKQKVWPLRVSELLFCGRSTTKKLEQVGIYTIGDLAEMDHDYVNQLLGKNGLMLWSYANGLDDSPVMEKDFVSPMKSVGHGITCTADLKTEEEVWKVILELCQDIGHRLRIHGLKAQGVQIAIRSQELFTRQYQGQLSLPTIVPLEIAKLARELFQRNYDWKEPVRSVTVRAINLAAITSRPNKHWIPTHIELGNHVRGLHNDSVILLEQVRTIDRIRLRGYVGSLSGAMMRKVDEAILVSFGVTVQRRT